jgi:hypothetical protein
MPRPTITATNYSKLQQFGERHAVLSVCYRMYIRA